MFSVIVTLGLRHRFRRGLASLLSIGCMLALFGWMPIAQAHAALVAAEPADAALLTVFPAYATLRFNEPVSPLVFKLVSPDGATQTLEHVAADDAGLHIDLPMQTRHGTYALSWRVISADGHPVGGTLVFSVGEGSTPNTAVESAATLLHPAIWLARVALYVALFFGVGGALFRAFMGGADCAVTRWPRRALWLGFVAVPICFALQGLDALDAPWRGVLSVSVWRAALNTSYATTLALALLSLVAALMALAASRIRLIRFGAATAGLLLGMALAASGHASAAPPQWLARPAVLLHGIAIAAWLGALLPLFALLRADTKEIAAALRLFSRRIPFVVVVLIVTGVVLALLQVDRLDALWRTAYGRILLAKLTLVAVLFMLAAWNRYRLTDRVLNSDGDARHALGRMVAAEIGLALCVLAVVALWRFTPPPRALDMVTPTTVSVQLHDSAASAQLILTPARHDQAASLRLLLTDMHSMPLLPKAVIVSFGNTADGLEPLQREATQVRPGLWEISPLSLPMAAHWDVRVDILLTDFDRVRLQGVLDMSHDHAMH